jgi:hypothetical protein
MLFGAAWKKDTLTEGVSQRDPILGRELNVAIQIFRFDSWQLSGIQSSYPFLVKQMSVQCQPRRFSLGMSQFRTPLHRPTPVDARAVDRSIPVRQFSTAEFQPFSSPLARGFDTGFTHLQTTPTTWSLPPYS